MQGCKDELAALLSGQSNGGMPEAEDPSAPAEKGRRRKSRFSVKDIFNIQDKKPPAPDGASEKGVESAPFSLTPLPSSPLTHTSSDDAASSLAADLLSSDRSDKIFDIAATPSPPPSAPLHTDTASRLSDWLNTDANKSASDLENPLTEKSAGKVLESPLNEKSAGKFKSPGGGEGRRARLARQREEVDLQLGKRARDRANKQEHQAVS